jgi:Fur family ferric uptake transcriptional regulator
MHNKMPRETKQRNAIRRVFDTQGRPLSPKEVLDVASQEVPNLGIATVYRNINEMIRRGTLAVVEIPGQSPRYTLAEKAKETENQSLLVCKNTNRVFHGSKDQFRLDLPQIPGFEITGYQVIVYGNSTAEGTMASAPEAALGEAKPRAAVASSFVR